MENQKVVKLEFTKFFTNFITCNIDEFEFLKNIIKIFDQFAVNVDNNWYLVYGFEYDQPVCNMTTFYIDKTNHVLIDKEAIDGFIKILENLIIQYPAADWAIQYTTYEIA